MGYMERHEISIASSYPNKKVSSMEVATWILRLDNSQVALYVFIEEPNIFDHRFLQNSLLCKRDLRCSQSPENYTLANMKPQPLAL